MKINPSQLLLWVMTVIGFLLVATSQFITYEWLKNLTTPVGQALFASGVVGWLVDRLVRERFLREVARNVYGYLLGPYFPLPAKEFINDFIKTELILTDYQCSYEFSIANDGNLHITVSVEYNVRNHGVNTKPYRPKLQIFKNENPEILQLTCYTDMTNKYSIGPAEISSPSERPNVSTFLGREASLPPVRSEKYVPYKVLWRYIITKPIQSDDLISFGHPTIGVSVRAQYDAARMIVGIDESVFNMQYVDKYNWRAENTLFHKRQHIQLWWKPVEQND